MSWYKVGTVSVTPGSNAVIGTGTSFIANSRVGDAFRGPDGGWYEVTNIASNTALSISPGYQGAADASGGYALAPMQGYVKDSADALRAATQVIASGVTDMEQQVATATEAAQSAAQSKAGATEQAGIASSAAAFSTENKEAAQLAAQQSQDASQYSGAAATRSETARDSIIQSEQAAAASAAAAEESAEHAEEVTLGKAASGDNNDITSLRALTADGFDRVRQGLAPLAGATAGAAGVKGLVPAPSIADRLKVLSGAGTWVALPTGAAWGAITGTLSAQPDLWAALTGLDTRIAATEFGYSSAALTIVPGGVVTLNHGLGSPPQKFWIEATCTASDWGYAVGTVIRLNESLYASSGNNYGATVEITNTQIIVNTASAGYLFIRKDTKAIERMNPACWTIKYKASKS